MSADLHALRRRLTGLVFRDVAEAYQRGVLLVMMALVYLFTAWPPDQIRAALRTATPEQAAKVLALAMLAHHLASAPLIDRMLAGRAIAWWWQLPVSRGFWRRLHARHLIHLHLGWIAVAIYAALPGLPRAPWHELAHATAWIAAGLAAATLRVQARDRPPRVRVAIATAAALVPVIALLVRAELAAALGLAALAWAWARLDRPLPERAPPRRVALPWGRPALALTRLHLTLLARAEAPRLAALLGLAVSLSILSGLALVEAGERARGLVFGAAILSCSLGAGVIARADHLLAHDRGLLDAWGVTPSVERLARALTALLGALPFVLLAAPRLPLVWTLELAAVLAWACVGALRLAALAQARLELGDPRVGRVALRVILAVLLVVLTDTPLVLLAWALLEAIALPDQLAHAEALRLRVSIDLPRAQEHA